MHRHLSLLALAFAAAALLPAPARAGLGVSLTAYSDGQCANYLLVHNGVSGECVNDNTGIETEVSAMLTCSDGLGSSTATFSLYSGPGCSNLVAEQNIILDRCYVPDPRVFAREVRTISASGCSSEVSSADDDEFPTLVVAGVVGLLIVVIVLAWCWGWARRQPKPISYATATPGSAAPLQQLQQHAAV
jgi:hypothetical protein